MARRAGELALAGGERPQLRRRRRGFTAAKQEIFFTTLAATCNVSLAAEAAGVCKATVYAHRRGSAKFRARWALELREAYAKLELALLDRALNGTVRTVTRADGRTDRIHDYPNAVALTLLRRHQESAAEAGFEPSPADVEELRGRLASKLARLRRRLDAEGGGDGGDGGDGGSEDH